LGKYWKLVQATLKHIKKNICFFSISKPFFFFAQIGFSKGTSQHLQLQIFRVAFSTPHTFKTTSRVSSAHKVMTKTDLTFSLFA